MPFEEELEASYIDRACVLASRMFHEFTAGVAELAKTNVAEVLTFLQHLVYQLMALAYDKQDKNASKEGIIKISYCSMHNTFFFFLA